MEISPTSLELVHESFCYQLVDGHSYRFPADTQLPAESIFFSVHYLVIYYLLQPYNAGTEIKSGMYQVVTALTYVVCYAMIQIKIPTFVFGMAAIGFSMLYCVTACVLVYKIAPKTLNYVHKRVYGS